MRRSQLPIETLAAISFVLVASLVAIVVLVRHVDDGETVQAADRSPLSTVPGDQTAPAEVPTTTTVAEAPTTTDASVTPARPNGPTTSTTSTTSTTRVPTTTPPAPPVSSAETPPSCPGLVSETYWTSTGEDSLLVDAAGAAARYTEVVTNESDEPCTLATNRCGSTAELRTATGERTDRPPLECSSDHREEILEPGEQRTEQLSVGFPVPPGDYRAHIRRYDGTVVTLPVRLDDRLPACPTDALDLRVNGAEQGVAQKEIRDSGMDVGLIISGASPSCTVRAVESRLRLDDGGEPIDLVDETHRWLADLGELGIRTHLVAPPTDVPPGEYEGVVTIVLEDGGTITAPFDLVVR